MKKSLPLLILFFLTFSAEAQYRDWTDAEVYLSDSTQLKGKARLTMLESKNPNNLVLSLFTDEYLRYINVEIKQRKSTKFTPVEVDSVIFHLDYKEKRKRVKRKATYIPIIKKKNENKVKLGFAELVIDGNLKLVRRGVTNTSLGSVFEESLLIKDDEEAVIFNYIELKSFKKRATEYFSDCPDLITKFENNEFKREDLVQIVNYYNDNCAK